MCALVEIRDELNDKGVGGIGARKVEGGGREVYSPFLTCAASVASRKACLRAQ